jgi:hypothetical protein
MDIRALVSVSGGSLLLILGASVLSSQRILLPELSSVTSLLFISLYIYFFNRDRASANAFCLMALFTCVDNGGGTYTETPAFIRYFCYGASILPFLANRFDLKKLGFFFILVAFYLFITLLNQNQFDNTTLFRDILLLTLFGLVFCSVKAGTYKINMILLVLMIGSYLLFELINFFLYEPAKDYLNYNSTKALIVIVPFYLFSLMKRKPVILYVTILFTLFTLFILTLYVTRMILVFYILVLGAWFISNNNKIKNSLIVTLIFLILFITGFGTFDFEKIKLVHSFSNAFEGGIKLDSIKLLDPVRYYESKAFFETGFGLLVGNGLGSGYLDNKGYFSFIQVYDTAFSLKELQSGYFYNFHDFWVDIGFRFGLVFLLIIYVPLLIGLKSKQNETKLYSSILIILMSCSFYSTGGIIMSAMFYFAYLNHINIQSEASA